MDPSASMQPRDLKAVFSAVYSFLAEQCHDESASELQKLADNSLLKVANPKTVLLNFIRKIRSEKDDKTITQAATTAKESSSDSFSSDDEEIVNSFISKNSNVSKPKKVGKTSASNELKISKKMDSSSDSESSSSSSSSNAKKTLKKTGLNVSKTNLPTNSTIKETSAKKFVISSKPNDSESSSDSSSSEEEKLEKKLPSNPIAFSVTQNVLKTKGKQQIAKETVTPVIVKNPVGKSATPQVKALAVSSSSLDSSSSDEKKEKSKLTQNYSKPTNAAKQAQPKSVTSQFTKAVTSSSDSSDSSDEIKTVSQTIGKKASTTPLKTSLSINKTKTNVQLSKQKNESKPVPVNNITKQNKTQVSVASSDSDSSSSAIDEDKIKVFNKKQKTQQSAEVVEKKIFVKKDSDSDSSSSDEELAANRSLKKTNEPPMIPTSVIKSKSKKDEKSKTGDIDRDLSVKVSLASPKILTSSKPTIKDTSKSSLNLLNSLKSTAVLGKSPLVGLSNAKDIDLSQNKKITSKKQDVSKVFQLAKISADMANFSSSDSISDENPSNKKQQVLKGSVKALKADTPFPTKKDQSSTDSSSSEDEKPSGTKIQTTPAPALKAKSQVNNESIFKTPQNDSSMKKSKVELSVNKSVKINIKDKQDSVSSSSDSSSDEDLNHTSVLKKDKKDSFHSASTPAKKAETSKVASKDSSDSSSDSDSNNLSKQVKVLPKIEDELNSSKKRKGATQEDMSVTKSSSSFKMAKIENEQNNDKKSSNNSFRRVTTKLEDVPEGLRNNKFSPKDCNEFGARANNSFQYTRGKEFKHEKGKKKKGSFGGVGYIDTEPRSFKFSNE